MMLFNQFSVSFFDLFRGSTAGDAEYLIVVLFDWNSAVLNSVACATKASEGTSVSICLPFKYANQHFIIIINSKALNNERCSKH